MINQTFKICDHDHYDTSQSLTIANETEVSITQYILTCFSSIETKWRHLMIPFAVADIKYNILGTPFFEKYVQKINNQDFTMNFKHSSIDQPANASFTTLVEKIFPFFSFNYQTKTKEAIYIKPNTVHFPLKNSKIWSPNTENHEPLFPDMPRTLFLTKLKLYFSLKIFLAKTSWNSCAVFFKNIIMHMATLPTGIIGYIEIPLNRVKPFAL